MDLSIFAAPRLTTPAVLVTALLLAVGPPASAQVISGTILDAATGEPVAGAAIEVADTARQNMDETISDDSGRFTVRLPHSDRWVLTVERLGFEPFRSEPIHVRVAEWLIVEITLAEQAIALDPIVVTSRRSVGSAALQRFYERRDRAGRSGFGRFVVREEIDRASPLRPTDLLYSVSGIRVVRGLPGRGQGVRMSGGCIPAIYIDGMQINRFNVHDSVDDYVSVLDIEGIEVYRGPTSQVPQYHDSRGCGLLLVWTRAGVYDPDSRFSWRPILTAMAAIGAFFLFIN